MSFRDKMKASKQDLNKRHEEAANEEGKKYGSIFLSKMIPKGVDHWRPKVGEHDIDIIPFFAGKQHPKVSEGTYHYVVRVFVYMNVGALNVPYVSPSENWGEPDPIKEWMTTQGRMPKDLFKKVASKDRCVFLVWCHDTPEEEEKGIQIWEASEFTSFEKMEEQSKRPRGGGHLPFSDPDNGSRWFFEIAKEGTFTDSQGKEKEGTKYKAFKFIERPKNMQSIPDEIMNQSFSLDECINMHPDFNEMYKAHHGQLPAASADPEKESTTQTDTPTVSDTGDDEPGHITDEDTPSATEEHSAETETTEQPSPSRRMPARRLARQPAKTEESVAPGTCPHGHEFGKDMEQHPECKSGCA
ncbi:hypothetical protein LCGC14_2157830, partial [marine sediment metagenome]